MKICNNCHTRESANISLPGDQTQIITLNGGAAPEICLADVVIQCPEPARLQVNIQRQLFVSIPISLSRWTSINSKNIHKKSTHHWAWEVCFFSLMSPQACIYKKLSRIMDLRDSAFISEKKKEKTTIHCDFELSTLNEICLSWIIFTETMNGFCFLLCHTKQITN